MMGARPKMLMVGAALAAAFAVTGCATEKYVNTHVAAVDEKINNTQSQADVEKQKIADHEAMLASLDKTTRAAYERAEAAGKLAEGKFLYNVTLQDDGYKFKTNKYALTDDEKALHDAIKNKAVELEAAFDKVKPGRYKALSLTALEEAVMWIIKELTS